MFVRDIEPRAPRRSRAASHPNDTEIPMRLDWKLALPLVACGALAAPLLAQDKGFKKEAEIVLEGEPFFDYLTVDPAAKRLYVAHSPNVDVIDLEKSARIGTIPEVSKAHGIALWPELKKGFATSGAKNKAFVFDLESLKSAGEVKTGGNPDAVLAVTTTKEIWTFNGKSGDVSCIDPASLEVKATIKLPDKPEFAVEYPEKGMVFCNIEDKDCICALDAKKHEVLGTYALDPGKGPTGLAIDVKNGLLFSGCTEKLVAVDIATKKVVAALDIGKGCDGVAFDPGTGFVFASCGEGKTYVAHVKNATTIEALAPIETAPGARTCTVDPTTHRLYVCAGPKRNEKGAVKVLIFSSPSS
jgi:DNA-binding beta-propeller fold protein YncE